MADRDEIVEFIDGYLNSRNISDISMNGLQIEGKKEVRKIAFGVSASLACMRKACDSGADMLVTHHGILWGKSSRITGAYKDKLEFAFGKALSLASWHLPLDIHGVVGNNARLLAMLGGTGQEPFGRYHGQLIGVKGKFAEPVSVDHVAETLKAGLDASPLCFSFGKEKINTVGIVSGGAADILEEAVSERLDLYLTGAAEEYSQETARDNKINFIAAGHYNSEKTGVKALAELVAGEFSVETFFADVPNPV